MSYTKTVWTNDALPAINATNLNNIENGIKANEAKIDSLVLGENLKGEFTPSIAQEYPLTPAINDSWYIDGLTGAGYTFTTGVLTGQTADNFDKLVYISTGWFLVEDTQNYVHNTGDETIAGVKTFSSSPIVPAPTTDFQASTKKYVDDSVASSTLDINALTEKTAPIDADELALADSAATFSLKKLTWANLKATLKTYFDTIYRPIGYKTPFMHIQDQKPSSTQGGASSIGVQTRTLNTVLVNDITGASLSSNLITLPAGEYYIEASAPAFYPDRTKLIFNNVTDASDEVIGQVGYSADGNTTTVIAHLSGEFELLASKSFQLNQYFTAAKTSNGLGIAVGDGTVEIYADVKIWKVG